MWLDKVLLNSIFKAFFALETPKTFLDSYLFACHAQLDIVELQNLLGLIFGEGCNLSH